MTLIEFLEARLAESETRAQNLMRHAQDTQLTFEDGKKWLGRVTPGRHDWPDVEAICQETLVDLMAKREIIQDFKRAQIWSHEAGFEPDVVAFLVLVLKAQVCHLAASYATHPDYRQEWGNLNAEPAPTEPEERN